MYEIGLNYFPNKDELKKYCTKMYSGEIPIDIDFLKNLLKYHPNYLQKSLYLISSAKINKNIKISDQIGKECPIRFYTDNEQFIDTGYYKSINNIDPMDTNSSKVVNASEFVYFIATSDSKYIKIGKSKTPRTRLSALQTSNPQKLYLINYFLGGFGHEDILHQMFLNKTEAKNEWRTYDDNIRKYILLLDIIEKEVIKTKNLKLKETMEIYLYNKNTILDKLNSYQK